MFRYAKIKDNKVVNILKFNEKIDKDSYVFIEAKQKVFIGQKYINGSFIKRDVEIFNIENHKEQSLLNLNKYFEKLYKANLSKYTKLEIDSFPLQEQEYLAYQIDPNTPTPTIDGIIEGTFGEVKNEYRLDLINRIGENVIAKNKNIGLKQKLTFLIKNATTKEEIDNVMGSMLS